MMRLICCMLFLVLLFNQCGSKNVVNSDSVLEAPYSYYSDYFVFLADDGGEPLVIPIDINWHPVSNGYEVEYKSWYGTEKDWPIDYFKKVIPSKVEDIPDEAFSHADTDIYDFDPQNLAITAKIEGAPELKIQLPAEEKWVLPSMESDFPTYGFRTSVRVDGKKREGWMLYEKIRFTADREFKGFEAFYWMPLLVDGDLYHFSQHRGEQNAVRWSAKEGGIEAENVEKFSFNILKTIPDDKSGRKEVPASVQIQIPQWELDISLRSSGQQIGYGDKFPKGLALFRQSLLQSEDSSVDEGYGMMELILANN